MKKMILCALCMSTAYLSSAQSLKTYLQVNVGAHSADQKMSKGPVDTDPFGFGPGYSAGISAGIIKKRLKIELGVNQLVLSSSFKAVDGILNPATGEVTNPYELKTSERYSHILVPLTVSYNLLVPGKKWRVAPLVGFAYSYNYKHELRAKGGPVDMEWEESNYLGKELRKSSLWGGAGVEVDYSLTNRFQLVAAPEVWYMITSFTKSDITVKQHTLMYGGQLSLRYFLRP